MYKLLLPSLMPSECRLNSFRASEEHLRPQIQQRMARLALAPWLGLNKHELKNNNNNSNRNLLQI